MPGNRANSYGGNGHGDQPFTVDWFIPNTTTTPIPVGLNFKDSALLAEFNRIAQMLDWDNINMNSLSRDFSFDHLNYGPYVQWPYPSSMPADYWNPGYIPILGQNFSSVNEDYCEAISEDGLGFYPMNLNARINGTDTNLSDKNYSNMNNSYISPGSAFDNNEQVNDPYNLTVDSLWSKGALGSEAVSFQVVKKPEISDKSNGRATKLIHTSYTDVVKLPPGETNASKLEKYSTVFNELVDEVVVESILASKVSYTFETAIANLQVTKNDISRCSCMSCHVQKNGPTKDSKFLGKEPVLSLIVTMHNLSELLLHHCSSETCELREQDIESLEKVVDSLNTCMLKRNGRESVSKLHQGISIGKHSGSKDDTFSDSVSVESGSDMTPMIDKSDQAVKVLIKNLHEKEERRQLDLLFKNFSLKVEARCDNLKIEMEECKPDNEKDVDEHSISELDGIDKLATKVKDSPVSLPGTACNSDSDDEFDDDDDDYDVEDEDSPVSLPGTACNFDSGDEFDDDDEVFHSIMLADCCSDWEFVSDEELSGLNSSS